MLSRAYDIARELGDRTEMAYALADRPGSRWSAATSRRPPPRSPGACRGPVAAGVRIIVPLLLEAAGSPRGGTRRGRAAVRLWSAATAERTSSGFVNMPADERLLDAHVAAVRARPDPTRFAPLGRGHDAQPGGGTDLALDLARR